MSVMSEEAFKRDAIGKTIHDVEYVEDSPSGNYWVFTFTDGSEISVVLMADLVRGKR
jgi:hypothetical protein